MPYVTYERDGHIAIVTLNRPERLNALGRELMLELREAENRFAPDDEAWIAIFTGAGPRAFCAGLDLKETAEQGREGPVLLPGKATGPAETDKPTIAAVNGICYGDGFELVRRCDVRICSENASFAMAEVRAGRVPVTGLFTLPRLVGQSNAMWLILSSEPIDAAEAYRIGLVTRVVPLADLMPTAIAMAHTICGNAPLGVRAAKRIVRLGGEVPMDYGRRLAASLIDSVWGSEDAREAAAAFVEKRRPQWRMR
ncbi:MAG: enoyl-CoA hydratase-related protein [Chloroflexota bacterium]|nr:enoyl-CoA hydratase-related protein [Chloroflexota bacterium]